MLGVRSDNMERKKKLKSVKYKGKTLKIIKTDYRIQGKGGRPIWSIPTYFVYVAHSKIPIGTGTRKDTALKDAKKVIDADYWK